MGPERIGLVVINSAIGGSMMLKAQLCVWYSSELDRRSEDEAVVVIGVDVGPRSLDWLLCHLGS